MCDKKCFIITYLQYFIKINLDNSFGWRTKKRKTEKNFIQEVNIRSFK